MNNFDGTVLNVNMRSYDKNYKFSDIFFFLIEKYFHDK